MAHFGDRLRQEREQRGLSLEEIARATKVAPHLLEALEGNRLDQLPGGPFNKGFVRSYAVALGLDPEELIAAYTREEKAQGLSRTPDADRELLQEMARLVELRSEGDRRTLVLDWSGVQKLLAGLVVAAAVVAGLWLWQGRGEGPPAPGAATTAGPEAASDPAPPEATEPRAAAGEAGPAAGAPEAEPPAPKPEPPAAARPTGPVREESGPPVPTEKAPSPAEPTPARADSATAKPEPVSAKPETATAKPETSPAPTVETRADGDSASSPSRIRLEEAGVGTGVEGRLLVGRTDRFRQGDRVWFWNRAMDGRAGEVIRHVWLREGAVMGSNEIRVGGPHWRNWSWKTMGRNAVGDWAVEVRDEAGNVLERVEFTCLPAGG